LSGLFKHFTSDVSTRPNYSSFKGMFRGFKPPPNLVIAVLMSLLNFFPSVTCIYSCHSATGAPQVGTDLLRNGTSFYFSCPTPLPFSGFSQSSPQITDQPSNSWGAKKFFRLSFPGVFPPSFGLPFYKTPPFSSAGPLIFFETFPLVEKA